MTIPARRILCITLLMAALLTSSHLRAQEKTQEDPTAGAKEEVVVEVPDLADVVPLATKLSSRLAALQNSIEGGLDVSLVEEKYAVIEADLADPADKLQRLKNSKDYNYNRLVEIKTALEKKNDSFEGISKPLGEAIRQLGAWRKEWLAEKTNWNEWQSYLLKEGGLDKLTSTFEKANDTIDTALNLIVSQLEAMLTVQEKAGDIQAEIHALVAELDDLILAGRRDVLLDASPPMFSTRYFSQFSSQLWHAVQKGLYEVSWPDTRFWGRQGWIVLLQGLLSLVVIIAVRRNRQVLSESSRWGFLAARPFSASLFLGLMATFFLYQYEGIPATWRLALTIVGGISFARLAGSLYELSWKRHFVYGLMILLIVTRLMSVVSLPLPLFRLYTVVTALLGLIFCVQWAGKSVRHQASGLYTRSLRLGALFFAVIIVVQLWGKGGLALYLFVSSINSMAIVLVFLLFMRVIRGGVEWVFQDSPLRRATVLQSDTDVIIRRAACLIDVAIWGLVLLPTLLVTWKIYDSMRGAIKGLLALGFNLGSQRISVGLLIASAAIFYGSFVASSIVKKLLVDEVLFRRGVERGVRLSIARLVHYVIISVGFLWAVSTLGLEITKLTIMLSALGVGIGFGLQGVVNNFVSGLILLFERPIRVGDYIEFHGNWSEIKRIGLRATTVQTFDHAEVIIPNADLVTNQVRQKASYTRRLTGVSGQRVSRLPFPNGICTCAVWMNRLVSGIGLPKGSPLREPINHLFLEKIHQPAWQDSLNRYLGI